MSKPFNFQEWPTGQGETIRELVIARHVLTEISVVHSTTPKATATT
jgi:hypothetical protein